MACRYHGNSPRRHSTAWQVRVWGVPFHDLIQHLSRVYSDALGDSRSFAHKKDGLDWLRQTR